MTENVEYSLRLSAGVDRVRAALTDPAQLRVWFAEHAEVELPDTYRFWGRNTIDGADGPAQKLLVADDTTLRFTWTIEGTETTVDITLEAEGDDTTVLSLTQDGFPGWGVVASGGGGTIGLIGTYWALALANLADHVAGREVGPLPDFTTTDLRAEYLVDASPERIFAALTDPAQFAQWFNFPIELELEVGGRWAMGGFDNNPDPARIVELEPNRRMSIDFGSGVGTSTWELEGSGGKTKLVFSNSGFDSADMPWAGWLGWLAGFAELRRFVELDAWTPLWIEAGAEVPETA
ncbi:SRPBCC family protein [Actinokineospora sp. G85]|uniref:SRPBCC family protein n=1 Tax=Actinokineospora sp. G85 TaxID=3406626 RepID=UPI003C71663C